jgi:hypothetical protein
MYRYSVLSTTEEKVVYTEERTAWKAHSTSCNERTQGLSFIYIHKE